MNVLRNIATGRNILILLGLFLLINFVAVPLFYPPFQTLDTLPSYTPSEAHAYLSSYGASGRQIYLAIELTLDLLYPPISALLFSTVILYTFQRAFPAWTWTHKLALLPFAVLIADYLENASIVTMLLSFPRELPAVAAASNVFTITKFDLSWLELIFIVGLLGWFVQVLRRRRLTRAMS